MLFCNCSQGLVQNSPIDGVPHVGSMHLFCIQLIMRIIKGNNGLNNNDGTVFLEGYSLQKHHFT